MPAQSHALSAPPPDSPAEGEDSAALAGAANSGDPAIGAGWRIAPLFSPLKPQTAIDALDALARKGALPGFATLPSQGQARRFRVAIFGEPFDRSLIGAIEPAPDGVGSRVAVSAVLHRKAPTLLIVGALVAIWPGLPMLDKMIPPAWNWWPTWTWYLPLVILPTLALAPLCWRRSERAALDHAREQLERIATALRAGEAQRRP